MSQLTAACCLPWFTRGSKAEQWEEKKFIFDWERNIILEDRQSKTLAHLGGKTPLDYFFCFVHLLIM